MSKYQSLNHQKFRLKYHIIFSTKYRYECLTGIEENIKRILQEISDESTKFSIIAIGVDKDHIHLAVKSKPTVSIDSIVRHVKQLLTYRLWLREEDYLSDFYYGSKRLLFTRGYFVESIGAVSEDKVLNYIVRQGDLIC